MLGLVASALNARPVAPVDPRDLHQCKLTAIHPADNDIHLDDDRGLKSRPDVLPDAIARGILNHVTKTAKDLFTKQEWAENKLDCADVLSPVFSLTGPSGLQVYVAPRYFPFGNSVDYFFMYDPRTGAVTKSPPLIFTKWWGPNDRLIKRPIVRTKAARRGQPALLVVEERTHNGTVYNAALYRYFEIGKDMSLRQILAIEARAYLLEDGLTTRKETFLRPGRVRIDVSTAPPRKWGSRGTVMMERSRSGQPFHVVQRTTERGSPRNGLVTYCDSAKSDDDFLRVGCDFYY